MWINQTGPNCWSLVPTRDARKTFLPMPDVTVTLAAGVRFVIHIFIFFSGNSEKSSLGHFQFPQKLLSGVPMIVSAFQ